MSRGRGTRGLVVNRNHGERIRLTFGELEVWVTVKIQQSTREWEHPRINVIIDGPREVRVDREERIPQEGEAA